MKASQHWLYQRFSAIALLTFVPILWLWFVCDCSYEYNEIRHHLANEHIFLFGIYLVLLVGIYHAYLGLDIIIDDYIKGFARPVAHTVMRAFLFFITIMFTYSIFVLSKGM
jgi:succinate dehydrogenase hydrophobic membrane anchor protein